MTTATATKPAQRQRVEGTLHRSLPATLEIRAAQEGDAPADGLLRLHLSVSSEQPYLRSSWWDDPWIETLGHKDGEIDLTRLNGGATVLGNHDRHTPIGNTPLAGIGAVERAWIDAGRLEADIVISRRKALEDLRQDIADNLVRNVSIGYQINERVLTRAGADGEPNEYRVTNWTPFEVSLVDIPADHTVGLGRSADLDAPESSARYRVVDLPMPAAAGEPSEGDRSMTQTATPAAPGTAAPTATPVVDPIVKERQRVAELTALGREFQARDDAERAIESGAGVDEFRRTLLAKLKPAATVTPSETPDIGMSAREIERFSFCRALLVAADPGNPAFRKAAAFELECSEASRSKLDDGREVRKEREAGITIPTDVLRAMPNVSAAAAQAATQRLIARAMSGAVYRDLVVGTASAGGNLVATDLMSGSFIELLRNKTRVIELGATVFGDLVGNVAFPRQTGGASHYWVGESGVPTESQASFDQVAMTPKTVGTYTDYSRRLLLQSSIDIEMFVRLDLALSLAQGIDLAALFGTGSGNQPTGVFNTSGVGAIAPATNGQAPTWDHVVQMEELVAVANADMGALSYITNAKVRSKLKRTQKFSGTDGKEIWQPGREPRNGIGEVNGYDAYVTNQIPSNLVQGSASNCSGIGYGNWMDLLIGLWGGLDLLLDPYAAATSGGKRVVALQDCDIAVRRPGSFAVMKDALTS